MNSSNNAIHSTGPIANKIRVFEKEHPHIDPFLLEGTITAFVLSIRNKPTMDDTILKLNWLGFIQQDSAKATDPHSKKLDSNIDNENVIFNYEMWIFQKSNQPTTTIESTLHPEIATFLLSDNSKNYFELLKNWEIYEYGSWHNTKKANIKKYLKKNHLN